MKGSEYFIMATVIGSFIFVAMFAGGTYLILERASVTQIEETRTSGELLTTTAAYIIEKCLKDGDFLTNSSLTTKTGKPISELCKIDFGAKVEDLENNRVWDFGYREDAKNKRTIFVNIGYPEIGEIHTGRLHVSA